MMTKMEKEANKISTEKENEWQKERRDTQTVRIRADIKQQLERDARTEGKTLPEFIRQHLTTLVDTGTISVVDRPRAVGEDFVRSITVTSEGKGVVIPSGTLSITEGNPCTFTAVPNAGAVFDYWETSMGTFRANPIVLTAYAPGGILKAHFKEEIDELMERAETYLKGWKGYIIPKDSRRGIITENAKAEGVSIREYIVVHFDELKRKGIIEPEQTEQPNENGRINGFVDSLER